MSTRFILLARPHDSTRVFIAQTLPNFLQPTGKLAVETF
jgi:hypothetical protein